MNITQLCQFVFLYFFILWGLQSAESAENKKEEACLMIGTGRSKQLQTMHDYPTPPANKGDITFDQDNKAQPDILGDYCDPAVYTSQLFKTKTKKIKGGLDRIWFAHVDVVPMASKKKGKMLDLWENELGLLCEKNPRLSNVNEIFDNSDICESGINSDIHGAHFFQMAAYSLVKDYAEHINRNPSAKDAMEKKIRFYAAYFEQDALDLQVFGEYIAKTAYEYLGDMSAKMKGNAPFLYESLNLNPPVINVVRPYAEYLKKKGCQYDRPYSMTEFTQYNVLFFLGFIDPKSVYFFKTPTNRSFRFFKEDVDIKNHSEQYALMMKYIDLTYKAIFSFFDLNVTETGIFEEVRTNNLGKAALATFRISAHKIKTN